MTHLALTLAEIYISCIVGYAVRTFIKIRKLEEVIKELNKGD